MSRRRGVPALLLWLAPLAAALPAGCMTQDANVHAQRLAQSAGLTAEQLQTDSFKLTTFARIRDPRAPVHIYIEGDGRAWASRSTPSRDPTPRHALALQLATRDPAPNVVYLARPCQFTVRDPCCEVAYWTGKRYARDVVAAMDSAVSRYAARAPGQPLQLIGYSGGGALAVLVASQRSDVESIRTVAGNLDLAEITRLHRVSPMPQSLDPIDEARNLAHVPQLHFSGGNDRVVPPSIARRFATAAGGSCVRTQVVPGMQHEGRWADIWPVLLSERVDCGPR